MSVNLQALVRGELVYVQSWPALDNVRFERIITGFEQHYDVALLSGELFQFTRGEGYLKLEKWDAFGLVDSGSVERLRATRDEEQGPGGNIVMMPSRYTMLRYSLNIRVALIYLAMAVVIGALAIGGSWIFWLFGYFFSIAFIVALVRVSLKRKLKSWLAKESWN
jgi:hypothetical protein